MPNTTSPNMNLILPAVSEATGPGWAQTLNGDLSIIDQHTHASGSGVPITQDAIELAAVAAPYDSLSFNSTNAYEVRSVRFDAQVAALALPTDLGCIYESGVDLYYNDGAGNQIRLTQGGSIVGTAGSISGLPSGTASASYSGGTFVWQSATNTAANMDAGSYIFRNATASSFGLTLSPPNAMGANYALVLPALPGAQSFVTLDASGNFATPGPWLGGIGTNQLANLSVTTGKIADEAVTTDKIDDEAVTTAKIADGAVTLAKLAAPNALASSSCAASATSSTSYADVNNLSVTITVVDGQPVNIRMIPTADVDGLGYIRIASASAASATGFIQILRDSTPIAYFQHQTSLSSGTSISSSIPITSISTTDFAATAGSHTYKVQFKVNIGTETFTFNQGKLLVSQGC